MTAGFPLCICPVCAEVGRESSFLLAGGALRCDAGHTFDIAREGYVNLLPASGSKDAVHGDLPIMLRSRRDFLNRGHYQFLAEALSGVCVDVLSLLSARSNASALLDVGCGEGYYLNQLLHQIPLRFADRGETFVNQQLPDLYGLDLAREAARLAAKRNPQLRITVGNTMVRLPFATGSMSMLLSLFAPRNPQEFDRVLAADGTLVVVIPTPGHLHEIRQHVRLLPIEVDKATHVVDQLRGVFELTNSHSINTILQLEPVDVRLLIAMTPNAWFVPKDRLSAIDDIDVLPTQASFTLMQFRKVRR